MRSNSQLAEHAPPAAPSPQQLQVISKELGLKAHHTVKYADDELRIFTTNKGNYIAAVPA